MFLAFLEEVFHIKYVLALLRILALLTFCLSHFPIVVAHLVECQGNTVTPEWSLITSQPLP